MSFVRQASSRIGTSVLVLAVTMMGVIYSAVLGDPAKSGIPVGDTASKWRDTTDDIHPAALSGTPPAMPLPLGHGCHALGPFGFASYQVVSDANEPNNILATLFDAANVPQATVRTNVNGDQVDIEYSSTGGSRNVQLRLVRNVSEAYVDELVTVDGVLSAHVRLSLDGLENAVIEWIIGEGEFDGLVEVQLFAALIGCMAQDQIIPMSNGEDNDCSWWVTVGACLGAVLSPPPANMISAVICIGCLIVEGPSEPEEPEDPVISCARLAVNACRGRGGVRCALITQNGCSWACGNDPPNTPPCGH